MDRQKKPYVQPEMIVIKDGPKYNEIKPLFTTENIGSPPLVTAIGHNKRM